MQTHRSQRGAWRGLWAVLAGLLVGLAVLALSQLAAGAALAWSRSLELNDLHIRRMMGDGDALSLTFMIALPVLLLVLSPLIKYRHKQPVLAYLAINPVSPRKVLIWCGYMLALLAVYMFFVSLLDMPEIPEWMMTTWHTVDNIPAFILAVSLLGPALEELLYRGYMLTSAVGSRLGPLWGSLLVAGLWAVTHFQYDVFEIAWIFLLGLLLCACRLATGSLIAPFVLHAVWNVISAVGVFWHLN